jgi:hypothetical protein
MDQSLESSSEHNSIVLCDSEMCVGEFPLNADFHVTAENHANSEDWRNTDASSKFNYFIEYLLNRADEGKGEEGNGGEIHIPSIGEGIGACTTLEILQRSPVSTSTCYSSMKAEILKSFVFWKNLLCWHRWRITIHMALRPVSDITTESAIFIFLSILSTIRRAFYKKTGERMREFTACLFIAIIQSMEEHLVVSALESSLLFIEGLIEIFSLNFPPYQATQPIWEHDGVIGYIVQHTMLQLISIASLPAQHARSPSPICIKAWETTQRCCDAVEEDFRAGIGQCWFLGLDSGTVAWKSRMSKLVSLSFTEAVIDALIEAIKDCMWMRGLLSELGYPQARPSVVFQDNKSALQLTNIDSIPTRTRHLANRLSFIKQEIERGTVELKYLPSWRMVADVLTKLLPANSHKS